MTIAEVIDMEIMRHLSFYGTIKRLDPFATHLLKTSNDPLMRFRRRWMRAMALRQVQEATRNQKGLNKSVASADVRGKSMQLVASIDPYFEGSMRLRDKAEWNDPDYRKYVKREEPEIFPRHASAC